MVGQAASLYYQIRLITYQAAGAETQRVQCAIAAGKLGISIFRATSAVKD